MKPRRRLVKLYCSFCGKDENDVFTLIAGPCVFICDECVAACNGVVAERQIKAGVTAVIGRFAPDR